MNHEPLDRLHLQQIAAAYAAGYRMARAELADDTKYYTLTQCYRKFGRGTVDRWATEGLIEIIKDGTRNSKCRVLAERIELVASQSNPSQLVRQSRIIRSDGKDVQTMGQIRGAGRNRPLSVRRGCAGNRRGVRTIGSQHRDDDISARVASS